MQMASCERKLRNHKSGIQTRNEVYLSIVRYFKEHGYAPSYQEIAEDVDISQTTAKRQVANLIDMGYLATDHPGCVRALRVAEYEFRRKKHG